MLDRLAVGLLKILALFFRALPLEAALAAGAFIGRVASWFRRGKGIAYLNLKAAFEGEMELSEMNRIARRSLENLGRSAAEMLRFPLINQAYMDRYTAFQSYDHIDKALAKQNGILFASGHFGNWELLPIRSCFNPYPKMKVLFREQKQLPLVNDYLNELRTSHGCELIGRESTALKTLLRALREGASVGILGDQASKSGVVVEFFGRKTFAAPGIIDIAQRTGSPVVPAFDVRKGTSFHEVHILPEIDLSGGNAEKAVERGVREFYALLEKFVRRYPDQWLWEHKRWKYSFMKTVLLLSDGKAGHESQTSAVPEILERIRAQKPELEFRVKSVKVEYKSELHRLLLAVLTPLFLKFIRTRTYLLKPFLSEESYRAVAPVYADFVVSAGSSLIPLNLLLATENKAKRVVFMRPAFPWNFYRYDLIVAPRHDEPVQGCRVVYTEIALNRANPEFLRREGEKLRAQYGTGKKAVGVFIGGDTKNFSISETKLGEALERILHYVRANECDLILTTSRRTRAAIEALLKKELAGEPCCRLLVIANESNIANVTYGILGWAEEVYVTEDSISMISEAVSSGKRVNILRVGEGSLSKKHERFRVNLETKKYVKSVAASEVGENGSALNAGGNPLEESKDRIAENLEALL